MAEHMTVGMHVICIWEGVYWLCPRGAARARANGRLIMSETESAHGPRRSQRERKQVSHFTSGPFLPRSFPPFLHLTYNSGPLRFLSEEEARQT